jgi:phage gp29-like protein
MGLAAKKAAPMAPPYDEDQRDRHLIVSGTAFKKEHLIGFLNQAENGETRYWYAFCDEMRARDSHLDAEMSKAEAMVAGARVDLLVTPASLRSRAKQVAGEAATAAEVASYVQDVLLAPAVQFDRAVIGLMAGFWKGLGALQVVVEPDGKGERILALTPIPSQRFRYPSMSTELEMQPGADFNRFVKVGDLGASVVVFTPESHVPSPARRGALRRLLPFFLVRAYGVDWWSKSTELFGIPWRVGKFPKGDETTRNTLLTALRSMASSGITLIPAGADVQLIESQLRGTGTSQHEAILDWTARQISIEILGATQTTDIQRGAGSQASTGSHREVIVEKWARNARPIAACLREQLVGPMVERRFGPEIAKRHTPEVAIRVEQKPDMLSWSTAMEKLVNAGFGAAIPLSIVNEAGFAPEPEEGEATLEKAPPPAPIFAPVAPPVPPTPPDTAPPEKAQPDTPPSDPIKQAAGKGTHTAASRNPGSILTTLEAEAVARIDGSGDSVIEPYAHLIEETRRDGGDLGHLMARVRLQAQMGGRDAQATRDILAAISARALLTGYASER